MTIFLALGFALFFLVSILFLTGRQVYFWLKTFIKTLSPLPFGILFGLLCLLVFGLFIYSRVHNNPLPRMIHILAHYALGFMTYLIMLFLFTGLLLYLAKLTGILDPIKMEKIRFYAGTLAFIFTLGFFIYGSIHARSLSIKEYTLNLEKENPQDTPLRLVLLSDFHLGYVVDDKDLERIVEKVNGLNPDLVLLAGDIFDDDFTALSDPQRIKNLFRSIRSRYGVYASLGNHDAGSTYEMMVNFLEESKIKLLLDETLTIDNKIVLAGRRDSSPIGAQGPKRQALTDLPRYSHLPVIVIDHQPANIKEYGSEVDLIVSGHTHRGQLFPFQWITSAVYTVDYGYYRKDENSPQVIVSSGVGTWGPPLRTSSDNEIVLIKIHFNP